MNNEAEVVEEQQKKKKKWLWLILLLLLLLGVAGGSYYWTHRSAPKTASKVVSGDFLPGKKDASKLTDEEIAKEGQKAVDASKFQMIINPDIHVDQKTKASDIAIVNPKNNAYPIAVTIKLDNGTTVYQSGGIDVGYEVKNAKMDKSLKAGNYKRVATFKIYDSKTSKEKGMTSTVVNLNVK